MTRSLTMWEPLKPRSDSTSSSMSGAMGLSVNTCGDHHQESALMVEGLLQRQTPFLEHDFVSMMGGRQVAGGQGAQGCDCQAVANERTSSCVLNSACPASEHFRNSGTTCRNRHR